MNPDSPQFMIFFGVTWVITAAYVVSFLLTMHRRQVVAEGLHRSLFAALRDSERPIFSIADIGFLFSGKHHEFDDAELSRRLTVTRGLFAVSLPLILTVFYFALTGGSADAR